MTGSEFPLYCARCAAEAIRSHHASVHGELELQIRVITSGEVSPAGPPGVWRVPRARVIVHGNSLCLAHLVDQQVHVQHRDGE